jgi:hypothetical protein
VIDDISGVLRIGSEDGLRRARNGELRSVWWFELGCENYQRWGLRLADVDGRLRASAGRAGTR